MGNSETTKQNIINSAKKLFYEKGYSHTTLNDIATESNIKSPLILHYFKNKDGLISEIFTEFLNKIIFLIDNSLSNKIPNSVAYLIVFAKLFLLRTYFDENNTRFTSEYMHKNRNYIYTKDIWDSLYQEIINERGITISEDEFHLLRIAEQEAKAGIIEYIISSDYFKTKTDDEIYTYLVEIGNSFILRYFGISQDEIHQYSVLASELIATIDCHDIKLL